MKSVAELKAIAKQAVIELNQLGERINDKGVFDPDFAYPAASTIPIPAALALLKKDQHYVKCSNITVIDIDGDTAFAREILVHAGGRCNLVAETRKGIHLYFMHTPQLRQGYQGKDLKVDIRAWNGKGSPDIILTPPSEYVADTTVRYKWIVTPLEAESLMPCPPEVISFFATVNVTI